MNFDVNIYDCCILTQSPKPCSVLASAAYLCRLLQHPAFVSRNIFSGPTLCTTIASVKISRCSQGKKVHCHFCRQFFTGDLAYCIEPCDFSDWTLATTCALIKVVSASVLTWRHLLIMSRILAEVLL